MFWTPAHLNKTSQNGARKQETPLGSESGWVRCGCWWLHLRTWTPALHLYLAWPRVSSVGQIRVLWGKKLSLEPDSQLSEVKKSRLNASPQQVWCVLPQASALTRGLWGVLLLPPGLQAGLGFPDKVLLEFMHFHEICWYSRKCCQQKNLSMLF